MAPVRSGDVAHNGRLDRLRTLGRVKPPDDSMDDTQHADDDRVTLEAARTAVLVIDLQQRFFEDGELARCRDDLVATVNRVAAQAAEAGAAVIEVRTEHAADRSTWTLDMRATDEPMMLAGSEEAQRVPELDPIDSVLVKTRDSAFHGTDLAQRLRTLDVRTVVLCGISTESCIHGTSVDAYAHDFRVVIPHDTVASVDWDWHDQALGDLRRKHGQRVVASELLTFEPLS